jgi:cytochrome bd-type quinol oxidase subunit 2
MAPETIITITEVLAVILFATGYIFHGLAKLDTYANPSRKANANDVISLFCIIFATFFFVVGIAYFGYKNNSYDDFSSFAKYLNL